MTLDLLRALALVFVIEGIMPFAMPSAFRESLLRIANLGDRDLRLVGLISMLAGFFALQAVRWLL
jgi:uncharacterized protein YjeT (DUF2065 family)